MATNFDPNQWENPTPEPYTPPVVPSSPFSEGWTSGVEGLKSSLYGAGAAVAGGFGAKGLEQSALAKAKEHEDLAGASSRNVKDVTDVGSGFDYAKWALGNILPSSLAFLGAAAAGRFGGGMIARKAMTEATKDFAATVGAGVGGMAASTTLEAGQIYPNAVETGVEHPFLRTAVGAPVAGALDLLGEAIPALRLGLLGKQAAHVGAIGRGWKGAALTAGRDVPLSMLGEGTTEAAQSYVERAAAGQPTTGEQATSDYLNSFFPGLIGGTLTAPVSAYRGYVGQPENAPSPAQVPENANVNQEVPHETLQQMQGTAPALQPAVLPQMPQGGATPVSPAGQVSGVPSQAGFEDQGQALAARTQLQDRLTALNQEASSAERKRPKSEVVKDIRDTTRAIGDVDASLPHIPQAGVSDAEKYASHSALTQERDQLTARESELYSWLKESPIARAPSLIGEKESLDELKAARSRIKELNRIIPNLPAPVASGAPQEGIPDISGAASVTPPQTAYQAPEGSAKVAAADVEMKANQNKVVRDYLESQRSAFTDTATHAANLSQLPEDQREAKKGVLAKDAGDLKNKAAWYGHAIAVLDSMPGGEKRDQFLADFEAYKGPLEANGITDPNDKRAVSVVEALNRRAKRDAEGRPVDEGAKTSAKVKEIVDQVDAGLRHPNATPWIGRKAREPGVIILPDQSIESLFKQASRREGGVHAEHLRQFQAASGEAPLTTSLTDAQIGVVSHFSGTPEDEIRKMSKPSQQKLFDVYHKQAQEQAAREAGGAYMSSEVGGTEGLSSPAETPNVPGERTDIDERIQPTAQDIAEINALASVKGTKQAQAATRTKAGMLARLEELRKQHDDLLNNEGYQLLKRRAEVDARMRRDGEGGIPRSDAEKQTWQKAKAREADLSAGIFNLESAIYSIEGKSELGSRAVSGGNARMFRGSPQGEDKIWADRADELHRAAEKEAIDKMEEEWRKQQATREQGRAGSSEGSDKTSSPNTKYAGKKGSKTHAPLVDGNFVVDGDGYVLDKKGVPIQFGHQREVGFWILRVGNKLTKDQIFQIANHPSGSGFTAQQSGVQQRTSAGAVMVVPQPTAAPKETSTTSAAPNVSTDNLGGINLSEDSGKPAWEYTREEYRKSPNATKVTKGSVLSVRLDKETKETLARFSNAELSGLASVMAVPTSGTKDEKIARILSTYDIRSKLSKATIEELKKKSGETLKDMLRQAGQPVFGNKDTMAASLVNWRNQARKTGSQRLADTKHAALVAKAVQRGEPVRAEVLAGYPELAAMRFAQGSDEWNNAVTSYASKAPMLDSEFGNWTTEQENKAQNAEGDIFGAKMADFYRSASIKAATDRASSGLGKKTVGTDVNKRVLQNRDRSDVGSIAQMSEISNKPDYYQAGISRNFVAGSPVVIDESAIPPNQLGKKDRIVSSTDKTINSRYAVVEADSLLPSHSVDGIPNSGYDTGITGKFRVIGGNGRAAGIVAGFKKKTTDTYVKDMKDDSESHGISPDVIDSLKNPVLVRVIADADVPSNIGDLTNIPVGNELNPSGHAVNDSNRVNMDSLEFGDEGQITLDSVKRFVAALPDTEKAGLIDSKGQPTGKAKDRLINAAFWNAYGDRDLIDMQANSADIESKTVMTSLVNVAPLMGKLSGAGELDIRPYVVEAAKAAINAKRLGVSLESYSRQEDITLNPLSKIVVKFFADNIKSYTRITEGLARAAGEAVAEASKPASDMFGEVKKRTARQILSDLINKSPEAEQRRRSFNPDQKGLTLEPPSKKKTFNEYIAEIEAKQQKRVDEIGNVEDYAIVKNENPKIGWQAILKNSSGEGGWRTQSFDENGFSGHALYNTKEEAIKAAASDGYFKRDDTALDRLQDTEGFKRGLAAADIIRRANGKEISWEQAHNEIAMLGPAVQKSEVPAASAAPALTLVGQTPEEVRAQQIAEEKAAKDAVAAAKTQSPTRNVTVDQVDMFNPQGGLFDQVAGPSVNANAAIATSIVGPEGVAQAKSESNQVPKSGELQLEQPQFSPDQIGRMINDIYNNIPVREGTTDEQKSNGVLALDALFGPKRVAGDEGRGAGDNGNVSTLLGSSLWKDFTEHAGSELIGKQAGDAGELAMLAQILRDPRFETMRVFFVKDGKIVDHMGWTSRLPGSVAFQITTAERPLANLNAMSDEELANMKTAFQERFSQLRERIKANGSDGYYLMHNHPSGSAYASDNDKALSKVTAKNVGGYLGHVVIDHNEYNVIDHNGKENLVNIKDWKPEHPVEVAHDMLGLVARDANGILQAARMLTDGRAGYATLIATNSKGIVHALAEVPVSHMTGGTDIQKARAFVRIRKFMEKTGSAGGAFLVSDNPSQFDWLIKAGRLTDSVSSAGESRSKAGVLQPRNPTQYGRGSRNVISANQMSWNVTFDAKDGIGAVPDNQSIDYMGFSKEMSAHEFLALAARMSQPFDKSLSFIREHIQAGKPLGIPFLEVRWNETKKQWDTTGHEGRHRATVIAEMAPNTKIPVHIFPRGGMRARNITAEMKAAPVISEDATRAQDLIDSANRLRDEAKKFLEESQDQREASHASQIDALEKEVDAAYERGDPNAENLDAKLAAMKELEDNGDREQQDFYDTDVSDVGSQLASAYVAWIGEGRTGPYANKEGALKGMRSIIEEGQGGQPLQNVTNEEIIAAAKDAYDAQIERRARQKAGDNKTLFSKDAAIRPYDERAARYTAIGREIGSYIERILGGGPNLQVGMFTATQGGPVGRFSSTATKDIIHIAYNARTPLSVAAHEGFHAIERRHLTSQDRAIIRRDLAKGSVLYNEIMRIARQHDVENKTNLADEISGNQLEANAYAFQFWNEGRLTPSGTLAKIFQKIKDFLAKVRNFIDGYGFKSIDSIFEAIDRGAYAQSDASVLIRDAREAYGVLEQQSFDIRNSMDGMGSQTDTPAFKRWFGDSKVVDAEGRPLVVYHGTGADFNQFDMGGKKYQNGYSTGGAAWFTTKASAAEWSANNLPAMRGEGGAPAVMPVYLSLKNPLVLTDFKTGFQFEKGSAYPTKRDIARIKDKGHDGFIVSPDGTASGANEIVVFEPTQIKSAIGNRGMFDPTDPNILHSRDALANPAEALRANDLKKQSIQDILRRVQAGELPQTQAMLLLAQYIDNADVPANIYSKVFGATKDGFGGSLKRFYLSNFSTGNNISKHSKGYKNVFDVISAYMQDKNKLIADNLDLGLSKWKPWESSAVDAKAAGSFLMNRTVGKWNANSTEYVAGYNKLNKAQKDMVDQANTIIPKMLLSEFEAEKIGYRAALPDEQYNKWEMDRTKQIERLINEGYVPERRYGNFGVSVQLPVTGPDGVTKNLQMRYDLFESQREAETWYRSLVGTEKEPGLMAGMGLVIEKGTRFKPEYDASLTFRQFLDMADRHGVSITQQERENLAKAMISADSTRRNRLFQRNDIPGFSEDLTRVLSEFVTNISNKVAYTEYGGKIQDALNGNKATVGWDAAKSKPTVTVEPNTKVWSEDGENSGYYHDEASKMVQAVIGPQDNTEMYRVMKMAATMQFLGGSLALVPVQLSSIPINVVPYLTKSTNYLNAITTSFAAMSNTLKNSSTLFDLEKLSDKTNKIDWVDKIPGFRDDMIRAGEDGTTMDTEIYQLMGMTRGGLMAKSRTAQKAVDMWMKPFRWSEKVNRVSTFAAAYKVGLENKLSGDKLYKFAQQAVFDTQIRYDSANRPAVMRNPIYALLFTFKTYPISMIELLENLRRESPKAALAMVGSLFLLAGVNGMPFRQNIMDIVDTLAQRWFGQPFNSQRWLRNFMKDASEAVTGTDMSGLMLNGLVNSFTDLNLQSRVGLHDLIPGTRLFARDVDWTQEAAQMLGPIGNQVIGAARGTGDLLKGNFERAIREAGPAAAQNMVKSMEQFQHGYALDGMGQKLVDVTGWNAFWQAMGFSNATLSNAYEMDRIDKQTVAFYNTVRSDFVRQITDGVRDGDKEKVDDTMALISKWNTANPDMLISIDGGSLRRHLIESSIPINQRTLMQLPLRLRGGSFSLQETTNP